MPVLQPTPENIAAAAAQLRAGMLVAVPTETVYGLAADATNPAAVVKIYEAKGRPRFNPLIAHVPDLATAQRYGVFNKTARRLAEAFWPGPLTLVVPQGEELLPEIVRAGLPSVALRVPVHPVMQALLRQVEAPLAAPSANKSGHVSATQAAHVVADFGKELSVLEGGAAAQGLESTIVDCTTETPVLLRKGALPCAVLEQVLGMPVAMAEDDKPNAPKAPGMLLKHYAPAAPVRLNALHVQTGEALLAFGPDVPEGHEQACTVRNLSVSRNLAEAAANLFAMLRELDAAQPRAIAVMPIPAEGLGEAMLDRLSRAAAGR